MKIAYVQTGGTIDKDYPRGESDHGYAFEIATPASKDVLKESFSVLEYEVYTVLKKDSLDISETDRDTIFEFVSSLKEQKVVITHGTDTMFQTAQRLSPISGKTVILTGAMLPEKFKTSDARFNIGMATAAVQILNPGVYIAIYGQVVPYEEFPDVAEKFESQTLSTESIDYDG